MDTDQLAKKIAVIRDPQIGFDASESFSPGTTYALCESGTNTRVFESNITSWNSGATDA